MIVDCFPFFNELDILEIRLNSLASHVDQFVLCEMPITHSGNPKPLYFDNNWERFKGFKIRHLIAPIPAKELQIEMGKQSGDAWRLEHWQREYLMAGIKDADPDDIVLLSDLDEIPNLEGYQGQEGAFKQKLYYYYLNCFTNTHLWKGTIATKKKNIKTLNHVRNMRNKTPTVVPNGGWHFSTMGSPEQIRYKIESFAHTELNTEYFKARIADNRESLRDPYDRAPKNWDNYPEYKFTVEMPSGPKWLLDNIDRYPHLFYQNGQAA